jgi:ArsR family transcriptional regulator
LPIERLWAFWLRPNGSAGQGKWLFSKRIDISSQNDYSIIMKQSNYAKIFKALSNEQRLKIFMAIYEQSLKGKADPAIISAEDALCCPMAKAFTKMCKCMDISRSTISHHFKELQSAGLITCKRQGQMYLCRVNEDAVASIKEFLQ